MKPEQVNLIYKVINIIKVQALMLGNNYAPYLL